ncbi:hypothetical protein KZZ07_26395, partial [Mameliella sp. CS4]|uniref:hypothetical protein n=1 Tax=Mameliella sp. CS4 TaxID=2862329 RepID=UPI001C5D1F1D
GGQVGKGTLSKYLSGQLQWPLAYVWALEDAAGRYPVSAVRGRAIGARADPRGCVYAAVGAASKEFGEAAEAALRVAGSADGAERAVALQEAREALDAMARLVAAIEAGGAP